MGIQSKEDYLRYLEADRRALSRSATRPRLFGDEVWKFERLLRRVEYYENCKRTWYHYPALLYLSVKFRLYSLLLGFTIPQHVFGPGLSIANRGTIVVNSCARIGANCRLHICVNIGSRAGTNTEAPIIGDNVYIGPGVVMFGRITIADNIAIGANSVVTKSFSEPDITIVGAPARKIGDVGTSRFYDDTGAPSGEQDPDADRESGQDH